jgi:hypothetical protein
MKMNKFFKIFSLGAILFLANSCVTKYIWGDKSYQEQINQFFVGSDGRYVAMLGDDYHYVFSDNSGVLKTILSLKQQGVLTISPSKSHLKLQPNNDVNGTLVMEGPFSILDRQDARTLMKMGFSPNRKDVLEVKMELTGRRYAAKYLNESLARTNTSHTITIYYRDSNVVKDVGKVAITPIAVGLDAVLMIGKVVVSPFTL